MNPCTAWVPGGLRYIRCGQPATGQFRFGCIHEHVLTAYGCDAHRADVHPGHPACSSCSAAGHTCLMNWERVDGVPHLEPID